MKRILIFGIGLVLMLSSCSDYLDINKDPSFPQSAPAETLFSPMLQEMVAGEAFDSRFIGKYIQNFAQVTANDVWDQHGYVVNNDAGGQIWRSHYYAIGLNVDLIIQDAEPKGKWGYIGASKAIRAWSWQTTTDYHGEIILKQAWEPNRFVFEYNTQEEVYAEVVRLAEEALVDLDKDDQTGTLAKGDLVYAGDRAKWKKFVYAVLARNAHHISNKPSYDPQKVIDYVDLSLASNTDNFNVPHLASTSTDANFMGPLRNNFGSVRQTQFILNLLNGVTLGGGADPRLPVMLSPSPDGIYRGIIPTFADPSPAAAGPPVVPQPATIPNLYGQFGNAPNPGVVWTGKYMYQNNAVFPLITYSELQFIKAEAAFIKGDLPTSLDAYTKGINAHMDYVASFLTGAALATFNTSRATYMSSVAVAQNTGELTKSKIMLQKYIALAGHGIIETWVDMRRYHYDNSIYTNFAIPAVLFADNGNLPAYRVRPRYNSEYVWNKASLDAIHGNDANYHTLEQWFSQP